MTFDLVAKKMSISIDGKQILCDGPGCNRTARPPVGLRPVLSGASSDRQTVAGWLFVDTADGIRHYCPGCSSGFMGAGTEFTKNKGTVNPNDKVATPVRPAS